MNHNICKRAALSAGIATLALLLGSGTEARATTLGSRLVQTAFGTSDMGDATSSVDLTIRFGGPSGDALTLGTFNMDEGDEGATFHFDAGNSSAFADIVSVLTNGIDDQYSYSISLVPGGGGGGSNGSESSFERTYFVPGVPDFAGATIDAIEFTLIDYDTGTTDLFENFPGQGMKLQAAFQGFVNIIGEPPPGQGGDDGPPEDDGEGDDEGGGNPVPEPGPVLLCVLALVGLADRVLRRRPASQKL